MRRPIAGLVLLLLFSTACSRPPGLFNGQNAHAHVEMLAGTIGSRPIGTAANARAKAYVIDQLRLFGFDVRVQDADGRRAGLGRTARVSNIIAVRPGRRSEAIALVSHYDSVPMGPGGADDALGVAVSLEAARVLAARADANWSLMVLVTDGEEGPALRAARDSARRSRRRRPARPPSRGSR
jgi:acetylornithine deacetylase/succinyl-diaminopimelate desuccinylase-like protein